MRERIISMSESELTRLEAMEALKSKRMRQKEVALQLSMSTRQVRRLKARYDAHGALGLMSRQRGKASNHQLPRGMKAKAVALIDCHYRDFKRKTNCSRQGTKKSYQVF
jgi:hypothetical protein